MNGSLYRKFFKEQSINEIKVFIFILVLVLLTRFLFSYGMSPELRFKQDFANDINHSVFLLGSNIANGNGPIATLYEANGLPLALGFAPFYLLLSINNFLVVYYSLILITILGYLIFIFWLTKKDSVETKVIYSLFFLAFILGVSGSAGIYMGNIDIILSLILGALMMNFIYKPVVGKKMSVVMGGLVNALMSISKIFLLPFSLVFGIFSSAPLLYFIIFILSSLGFLYVPHIFGANMSILTFVESLVKFNQDYTVGIHTWGNHSLAAISTLFINCSDLKACSSSSLLFITEILLGFITIILPFASRKTIIKLFRFGKLFLTKSLGEIDKKKLIILLFVFTNVVINLIPAISYEYRLFYSLPIVLILFKETGGNRKARFYCLLSMILLLLNGIWVTKFYDNDVGIFPAQFMNLFVLGHFYFMLKSSIENLKSEGEYKSLKPSSLRNSSYLIIPLVFIVLFMFRFIPNTKVETQLVVRANNLGIITSNCIGCNIVLPNGVVFPTETIKERIKSLPIVNIFIKQKNYSERETISLAILDNNKNFYNLLQAYSNNNEKTAADYSTKYVSKFNQIQHLISSYQTSYFDKNTEYFEQRTYLNGQYNGLINFLKTTKQKSAIPLSAALYKPIYQLLALQLQTLNSLEEKIWETEPKNNLYRGRLDVNADGLYKCGVNDNSVTVSKILINDVEYKSSVDLKKGANKVEISYIPKFLITASTIRINGSSNKILIGGLEKGNYSISFEYKSSITEDIIMIIANSKIDENNPLESIQNNEDTLFIDTIRITPSGESNNYQQSFSVESKSNKQYYFYLLIPAVEKQNLIINNFKLENNVDVNKINLTCKKEKN